LKWCLGSAGRCSARNRKGNVPQAINFVASAAEHAGVTLEDLNFSFVEHCDAIIVAELANGDERRVGHAIQDVGGLGRCR
jgi:hypothetical protein